MVVSPTRRLLSITAVLATLGLSGAPLALAQLDRSRCCHGSVSGQLLSPEGLEAAYLQSEVPLIEARRAGHRFFDQLEERLATARERAAALLSELVNPSP